MYYTFRIGEAEQCFEGTPDEIIQLMKAMKELEKKEYAITLKPFPLGPVMPRAVDEFLGKTALDKIFYHSKYSK